MTSTVHTKSCQTATHLSSLTPTSPFDSITVKLKKKKKIISYTNAKLEPSIIPKKSIAAPWDL